MLSARRIGTDLKRQMEEELRAGQRAARAAIQQVGEETQGTLRDQARAGFPQAADRMARTWRLQVFPRPGVATLRPSALISSRSPTIADAFDRGAVIRAKSGKFLAVPTQENRGGGLRSRKPRVTAQQMYAARKQTFTLPIKGSQNKLWCLRVTEASSRTKAGRIQRQAIAGNRIRVGQRRTTVRGESLSPGRYTGRLLEKGFVPMFILIKQVQLKKAFDIAGTARRASERIISVMRASYSAQR
jgi:hypothetical protein